MTEQINGEVRRILEEGPPLSWYVASGYPDLGITSIGYSDKLRGLAGGKVGKQLLQRDYLAGLLLRDEEDEEVVLSDEEKARVKRKMRCVETFITDATGFSPSKIEGKAHELWRMFRGQKSVPFDFYWLRDEFRDGPEKDQPNNPNNT